MSPLGSSASRDREALTQDLFDRRELAGAAERAELDGEIVALNLPLCDAIVRRYLHRGADRDDLAQVARLALLLAVRRFDPTAGSSFAAFAVPTILGEVKRYFRDACWVVRPPRPLLELRARARASVEQLQQASGREPSLPEVADDLGVPEPELVEALQIDGGYRPWSLDPAEPTDSTRPRIPESVVADPTDVAAEVTDRLMVRRLVGLLPGRDRAVVRWRFEDGLTQQQIADRLQLSQMQVSRILRRILGRLREELQAA